MSFFNKKTDIIKVELTQYGKFLLSKGKFKPVYYEFFDNDVLYDGKYASIEEERNDIQERIKNKTFYLKPQYNFSGVETKLKEQKQIKKQLEKLTNHSGLRKNEMQMFQQPEEKLFLTSLPIGSTILNDKIPAFNIISGDAEISSSSQSTTYNGYNLNIPEITMKNCVYKFVSKNNQTTPYSSNQKLVSSLFEDQTYFEIDQNNILFKIEEINTKDLNKNFEIEIFEVTSSNDKLVYLPLYFSNQIDTDDISTAEYYFDIQIDTEVPTIDKDKITVLIEPPSSFKRIT